MPNSDLYPLPPHLYRDLVNALFDTAIKYAGCQQLREQLAKTLSAVVIPAHSHILIEPPEGRWIKCSERMPSKRDNVLVYDAGGNKFICCQENGFWRDFRVGFSRHEITHWMPLPAFMGINL